MRSIRTFAACTLVISLFANAITLALHAYDGTDMQLLRGVAVVSSPGSVWWHLWCLARGCPATNYAEGERRRAAIKLSDGKPATTTLRSVNTTSPRLRRHYRENCKTRAPSTLKLTNADNAA